MQIVAETVTHLQLWLYSWHFPYSCESLVLKYQLHTVFSHAKQLYYVFNMKMTLELSIPLEEPHHSEPYLKASIMIHSSLSRNIIYIIVAVNTIFF
jgi:hypothetical protein